MIVGYSRLKNRIISFVNKHKSMFIFLLFFPHVYHISLPSGSLDIIEFIFSRLRVISFVVLLTLFLFSKEKPSKLMLFLVAIDTWIIFSTFINNIENINKAILYVCSSMSIALLIEMNVDDINKLLHGMIPAYEIHIYPNLITVILFRNISPNIVDSYNSNNYFLGTKNDMILYLLPALCMCIVYCSYLHRVSVRQIILITTILLTVLLSNSVTTLISFLVFILLFIYLYFIRKKRKYSSFLITSIPIITQFSIVLPYLFSGKNCFVDFVMERVYYRHSFISRTAIWKSASEYISNKLITGYGYINTSLTFVDDVGRLYYGNAHCDLIQRMINYGIVGLLLFAIMNIVLLAKINKIDDIIYKALFTSLLCSIYFTFISQAYHRFFEFITIMFLAYHIDKMVKGKDN